ncbi:MAG: L-rhamnose/proton symporter RhaT [Terracidiphilus sp.]|jgi:L-rhamnose-H+ transport protein
MPAIVWGGLALTLVAGLCSGNSMLPMKFAHRWQWENTWLIFSLFSLVIIPWTLAIMLAGNLRGIYCSLLPGQLLLPFILGAAWGVAQVLFGLSIARLGQALGFAIIISLGSLGGTLVPLLFKNRAVFATSNGALILSGLAVMLAGIVLSARAGSRREQEAKKETGSGYALALALAVLCGLLAPMINYSFVFGQEIAARAVQLGISPIRAAYTVWPVSLAGGLLPNLAYCFYLLSKKKTWGLFLGPWMPDAGFAVLMAVLWMGALAIYGVASVCLGALGTSVGWGLTQILAIMSANIGGLLAGEWTAAPASARRTLYAGLALLTAATVLLAAGNR